MFAQVGTVVWFARGKVFVVVWLGKQGRGWGGGGVVVSCKQHSQQDWIGDWTNQTINPQRYGVNSLGN